MTIPGIKSAALRKTLLWLAVAIAGAMALFIVAVAWEWSRCAKSPRKAELLSPLAISPEKCALGDEVKLRALFLCDWPTRPAAVSMASGAGAEVVSGPALSLQSLSWGRAVYSLDASLRPFHTGSIPEGSLHLAFSKGAGQPDEFDLKIPAFSVEPLKTEPGAQLGIAGKLEPKTPLWVWLASAALIVLLAVLAAWLLWRRFHKAVPPPPPWTLALDALMALRRRLSSNPASAEACLAELSDILRRYLEARFQLHARTQTSAEFLASLDRGDGPLTNVHRAFLKEFLAAADLVKFALAAADRNLLDDAILRAEKLVSESIPSETEQRQAPPLAPALNAKAKGGAI